MNSDPVGSIGIRRIVLSFALAIAALTAVVAGAAANPIPTLEDRNRFSHCVGNAGSDFQALRACIGSVADPCQDTAGGQTTVGMSECSIREAELWDEVLNDAYRELREAVSQSGREKLRDIQRAWIAWVQEKCELSYILFEGGTIARPIAAGCRARETAIRAIELREALHEIR